MRLSVCIDKIYDGFVSKQLAGQRAYNILNNEYDNELGENSTILINKSGDKFNNLQRVINYIQSLDKIKKQTKK